MELSGQIGDTLAVGSDQRWLSRLCWFLGRNSESRALRHAGGHDPASRSATGWNWRWPTATGPSWRCWAATWPARCPGATGPSNWPAGSASELPEIHALNNIGTALSMNGDLLGGGHRLARSLDLALAADAHEHAARAYTNLGSQAVSHRRLAEADRHLHAGIEHSTERGLDSWRLYMGALLASSLAEQGRYPDADEVVRQVLGKFQLAPTTRILVTVIAGQLTARRGGGPHRAAGRGAGAGRTDPGDPAAGAGGGGAGGGGLARRPAGRDRG